MFSGRDIKSLAFNKCTFTEETIVCIFKIIISAHCHKTLKKFAISGVPQIWSLLQAALMELFRNDLFSKISVLSNIRIDDCDVEIEKVMQILFRNKNRIEKLNFAGNRLLQTNEISKITDFQLLKTLNISGIRTARTQIISLFKALIRSSKCLTTLIANGIEMENSEWVGFYQEMPTLSSHLTKLSWMNNKFLFPSSANNFSEFLKNQKDLYNLSISCSDASPEIIVELSKGISLFLYQMERSKSFILMVLIRHHSHD